MKHWNKDNFKRLVKRGAAALLCAAAILPLTTTRSEAVDAAEIVSKIDMSGLIYIFKWTPLLDGDKARSGTNYATMLNEKNMVIRGPDRMFSGPDCAQIYVNSNYTPFNYGYRSAGDVFYTIGSMGAPIIHCVNDDTDNNGFQHSYWFADSEYPYAPRNAVSRNGSGDWDEFAEYYFKSLTGNSAYAHWIDDFCSARSGYTVNFSKIDLGQYNEAVSFFTLGSAHNDPGGYPGKFVIFKNISHDRDPAWQCYANGRIWCDQESDEGDRCWFNIWYGDPTVYSVLKQSYEISDGQTLTLDSTATSYRGIYIPPTATLKVNKGGTLAINECVYNDGTILCDGGTVIIQNSGMLAPLSDDGKGNYSTNGKNKIVVQNGGTIIIMDGGKLYTTKAYPMTLINSRLINFGGYVLGGDLELYSSFVENRKGGKIVCGYNYEGSRQDLRATFENATIYDTFCSGMQSNYATKIKVYDTEAHYKEFGWCSNEGALTMNSGAVVFTKTTDLQSTIDTAISNTAKLIGSSKFNTVQ